MLTPNSVANVIANDSVHNAFRAPASQTGESARFLALAKQLAANQVQAAHDKAAAQHQAAADAAASTVSAAKTNAVAVVNRATLRNVYVHTAHGTAALDATGQMRGMTKTPASISFADVAQNKAIYCLQEVAGERLGVPHPTPFDRLEYFDTTHRRAEFALYQVDQSGNIQGEVSGWQAEIPDGMPPSGAMVYSAARNALVALLPDGAVVQFDLNPGAGKALFKTTLAPAGAYNLALDEVAGQVYWTTGAGNSYWKVEIWRASLDGTNQIRVAALDIPQSAAMPFLRIAWDSLGKTLYWNNSHALGKFDGAGNAVQLYAPTTTPLGLSVDSAGGLLYWVEDHRLVQAKLDGTGTSQTVFAFDLDPQWVVLGVTVASNRGQASQALAAAHGKRQQAATQAALDKTTATQKASTDRSRSAGQVADAHNAANVSIAQKQAQATQDRSKAQADVTAGLDAAAQKRGQAQADAQVRAGQARSVANQTVTTAQQAAADRIRRAQDQLNSAIAKQQSS